jgi:methylated-DNA-[protein]-cysteine S-methyltransferase
MKPVRYTIFPSSIGDLLMVGDGEALSGLYFPSGSKAMAADPAWVRDDGLLPEARRQLTAY